VRQLKLASLLLAVFILAVPACGVTRADPAVTLQPVDGGADYYGRFAHGLPSDPSYFPVGVWFERVEEQHDIDLDRAAGLNLYVVITASSDLSLVRDNGMRVFVQSAQRDQFSGIGPETAAWELDDEIDMTDGPDGCKGRLHDIAAGLPADGRARYNNFGKGVLLWQTDAEAACYVELPSIVSSDLYWYTDPSQIDMVGTSWLPEGEGTPMTLAQVRRAANYGYQVDRMRALDALDGQRKPIWNAVEVGWPFVESAAQGARAIRPREVRAAVWHSLIAGARGIIYFNHSFGGPEECQTQHALRETGCYGDVRAMVTSVNAQIKALAPALNADTVTSGWTVGPAARAMVKWYDGHFYVFAAARTAAGGSATVSIPCVGDAMALRLYEDGSIPIRAGSFSDAFADGEAVHIYRIDGGSSCGLTPATSVGGGLGQPGGSEGPGTAPGSAGSAATRIGRARKRLSPGAKRVRVPVTCPADCMVRSRLTVRPKPHRITLARAQRHFAAGSHALVLRLTRRDRARIAQHRRLRLHTVLATSGTKLSRTQHLVARRR
jgi:hypothetical protein